MVVVARWVQFDDGETRPILRAKVLGRHGREISEDFLIDTGADRTAFSASLADRLQLPAASAMGESLSGLGGTSPHVLIATTIMAETTEGRPIRINAEFAAFTDPSAIDRSILGRDILDLFDLIVSRRRDQVLLLAERHRYEVVRA